MGIINVTPDSFSDGGLTFSARSAIDHGLKLLDEGADWLDIGGESTRPGSHAVGVQEELRRVLPVVQGLLPHCGAARISVDTSKAAVAAKVIEAGAHMINDVTALSDPDMAAVCAQGGVFVVLMHMRGDPSVMQEHTHYDDLLSEVEGFLKERAGVALQAGIAPERIFVDPGVGFGKALKDNPALIAGVRRLGLLGFPVLIGASRKRFIGHLTGEQEPAQRVWGSVGAALAAAANGASVLRVHDVAATRAALTVFEAVGVA
jgi:dihydropteroate synthase